MFERYTEQARRAVYYANIEALHRGEEHIGVRDLLVGLTWEEDSRVCRIARLKDKAVTLRAAVGIPHLPSTKNRYLRDVVIPADHEAKRAAAYAVYEADWEWRGTVDTDDLLRGILRFDNVAARALQKEGIDINVVRNASRRDRKQDPAERRSVRKLLRYLFLQLP